MKVRIAKKAELNVENSSSQVCLFKLVFWSGLVYLGCQCNDLGTNTLEQIS